MLAQLHQDFQDLLASKTYCAMFDNLQVFPPYPYPANPGIDTLFGMWKFHHRLKLSPDGRFAYTYGLGNMIQVFDLTTRELIEALTFPGGTNVNVLDVVFKPDGSEFYAVGLMSNSVDSVFATATVGAGQSHTWGPTTVVCDIKFVRLAVHATHPNTLYAIGRSATLPAKRGLYTLVPNAISLTPSPALNFNATGLLEISADGLRAYAAVSTGAVDTNDFNRIQYITLAPLAMGPFTSPIFGNEFGDDIKQHNGTLYVTGAVAPNAPKMLFRVNDVLAVVFGAIALGFDNPNRLVVLPTRSQVWITHADRYKASVYEFNTNIMRSNFRVPLQVAPTSIALTPDGSQVVALNMLNTISLVDVAVVDSIAPPSFTLEIGNTLPPYRTDAIQAFTDLFSVFAQSLKDAFCDKFLVECPECGPDDLIYLGTVEIKAKRVHHICNFNKRHYAKSFRTWSYWLSTVPILPMFKRAFAAFCCRIL
jgi:DNA-binding beta-propeller fold protein YncE